MAPILEEMERRVKEEVGVEIELPSYVDDIYLGIYDTYRSRARAHDAQADGEGVRELLIRADKVIKEVVMERGLPLEPEKEEKLVLRKEGRRNKRNKEVEKVKWLGVILDEDLKFDLHWKGRIAKARGMLGVLNGIGNSQWGVSANSWRLAYTGMVWTIATWGAEIGCRGQAEWRDVMRKLQYMALRKCTGAVISARTESVSKIAAVESVETTLSTMQDCFIARAIGDPRTIGDLLEEGTSRGELGEVERELLGG